MRGTFQDQGGLFSYVSPESRVPADHPLRKIRELVRDVLKDLSRSFARLYSTEGRPSVPPEQLLSALLIQVFYGIRSERQLMEQLDYNLLYRWFVGLSPDDPVWDPTTFTKNRERLQRGEVFEKFMTTLLNHREAKLAYMGHAMMENRHGLAVRGMVTLANGMAERRASEAMLEARSKQAGHRIPVGEDKAYDTFDH